MDKVLYQHPWMSLMEDEQGNAYIKMDNAGLTVPLTSHGEVVLINEYSVAYGQPVLYLPAGVVEPGEAAVEAINRELQEEAGFRAAQVDLLGELCPGIKYAQWKFYVYLARDLTPSKLQGDEQWEIRVEQVPLNDFERLIDEGRLLDSTVIAALYLARRFLAREST